MVHALIVGSDSRARFEEIDPDLPTLHGLVGGYITAIRGDGWHAYLNEEGLLEGLPPNIAGTAFARAMGWDSPEPMLVGPMVFLGDADPDEADLPRWMVEAAARTWGLTV